MTGPTIPKLTDDAISLLPLEAGRAELLEEIMSTSAPERPSELPAREPGRGHRWLVPLAAAAAVAGLVVSSVWWAGSDGPAGEPSPADAPAGQTAMSPQQPRPAAGPDAHRAVLDAPGWRVDNVEDDPEYGGSIGYANGSAWLEVTWAPADSYADYVADREHIVNPPAPGTEVEVLGLRGQMWAYDADDHTVIREVENGHWLEIRASGVDEAAFLDLLGRLRLVDLAQFEATLPEPFVTGAERATTAEAMLDAIQDVAGATWPQGASTGVESTEQDPYHLGADVAGAYACAWLDEFREARAAGDAARAAEAVRVLGTSREWPVLVEMDERGDYPEVVWEYADAVATGRVPEGYAGGLGCR